MTHLLTRYVHGQLRPALRAQVINHTRICPRCRAALAREERLAADLRREMPLLGQVSTGQLSQVWAGVWREIGTPPMRSRSNGMTWLPGVSVVLAVLLVLVAALPLLARGGVRAEAAPMQPRPNTVHATASPTPGMTDEAPNQAQRGASPGAELPLPQATVALAVNVGASPVPEPGVTVSPVVRTGLYDRQ